MREGDPGSASELHGSVRAGGVKDSVDGVIPRWVAAPTCESDVLGVVRTAVQERRAMLCTGGRTSVGVGNSLRSFEIALDLRNIDRIVERRPEDMTITVQAGITVQSLASELRSCGQRVSWDPDVPDCATIGGVLASNSTGGFAYGFGQPRDLVLGMTVIDGHGRRLRLGGRVVKNVAGYDLVRLFAGSHGSLGVITEATLRTHPLPQIARTVRIRFAEPDTLEVMRKALFASSLPLAAFDFEMKVATTTTSWTLDLRLEGSPRDVEAQIHRIRELYRGALDDTDDAWRSPVHASDEVVVRVGVAPADAIAFARDVERACNSPVRIGGRLGDGTLRVSTQRCRAEDEARFVRDLRAIAHVHTGIAVIECASTAAKSGLDVWDDSGPELALMRAIKSRFDPHTLFAPGRFAGEL